MVLFLLLELALAEPRRSGIIVNEQTKKCSPYFEGDACASYEVPKGWQAIFQGDGPLAVLEYNSQRCSWSLGEEKNCCEKFGFTFTENVKLKRVPSSDTKDPHCSGSSFWQKLKSIF